MTKAEKTTKVIISLGLFDGIKNKKVKSDEEIRHIIYNAIIPYSRGYSLQPTAGVFEGSAEESLLITIYKIDEAAADAITKELAEKLNQWEVWAEITETALLIQKHEPTAA